MGIIGVQHSNQSLMVIPMKATMRMPPVQMGLFDKKSDSKSKKTVTATFKGKNVEAKPGTPLKPVAAKLGVPVEFACENGQCGTCESKLNGRITRVCVAKVPKEDFKLDKKGWF